jgi:hypothetical protein
MKTIRAAALVTALLLPLALPAAAGAAPAVENRLQSALAELAEEHRGGGPSKAAAYAAAHILDVRDDSVLVTIRPTWGTGTEVVDLDSLAARGVRVLARSRNFIRALVPIGALEAAAASPGVAFVQRPITAEPAVTSEGVALTGADAFQALGFAGSGVKVAIIDGGFVGWIAAKNAGELPASVASHTYDFSGTGFATETEHGTAVAEAVHDMAPEAELYLMKIGDAASLEIALDTCIARGIDVVNHSMSWFGQPGDGTGPICAVANDARSAGILWVNAAGNHAWGHNQGTFTDTDGDSWHEFGAGSEEAEFATGPMSTIRVLLTWDGWPTTTEDYDLYVTNAFGATVGSSTDRQATSPGEPFEGVFLSGMPAGTYRIKVKNHSTTAPHDYDIFVMDQDLSTHRVTAGSITSPGDAAGALAVAAIGRTDWAAGPAEYFSSQGPTNDGRLKPDIAAPDNCDSYTYGYWYGTSLASPHVAGAAALLLSANPAWSVDDLRSALVTSALDVGPAGPDSVFGHGKLHLAASAPSPLVSFTATTGDGSVTLAWTNPSDAGFQSTTIRFGTSGYPTSPSGGSLVGVFGGAPGSDSSFVHTGLANGTTYWYSAYTWNGAAYSSAANAHAEAGDLTPPAPPALALAKGDEEILLSWTAPADPDLAGVRIVYATGAFPSAPDQGTPLPNGNAGNYPMSPSASMTDTLAGLTNGTDYHFAAFAYDAGRNYSSAAHAVAVPEDTIPPGTVLFFHAQALDGAVHLSWTHPSTQDFAGTRVRFSTGSPPAGPSDGDPVPNGSDGLFAGTPGDARSFEHTGLANGTTVYYAAFAYDEVPLYAGAAPSSATPSAASVPDTIPPGPPAAFTAAAGDGEVRLVWTNPPDPDVVSLRIRYGAAGHPATPSDGDAVENGSAGVFPGGPGASGSFMHEGRANGARVYYSAFAFDGSGNSSPPFTRRLSPRTPRRRTPSPSSGRSPGTGPFPSPGRTRPTPISPTRSSATTRSARPRRPSPGSRFPRAATGSSAERPGSAARTCTRGSSGERPTTTRPLRSTAIRTPPGERRSRLRRPITRLPGPPPPSPRPPARTRSRFAGRTRPTRTSRGP